MPMVSLHSDQFFIVFHHAHTQHQERCHEQSVTPALLREIVVKDAVLYVNGTAIKFKGVNRHDSDPVTGFVIGLEQMKKDLQMMKDRKSVV